MVLHHGVSALADPRDKDCTDRPLQGHGERRQHDKRYEHSIDN